MVSFPSWTTSTEEEANKLLTNISEWSCSDSRCKLETLRHFKETTYTRSN